MSEKIKVDKSGNSELIKFYRAGNIEKFHESIKSGANINCLNRDGFSLISMILINSSKIDNNKKFFDLLMSNDVHLKPLGRESGVLSLAIRAQKDVYYVKKILEKNSNVDHVGVSGHLSEPYGPPIFDAISKGNCEIIELLLEYNASLDICDSYGEPVLNHLFKENLKIAPKILKKMINYGANPNFKNFNGENALHYLSRHGVNKKLFEIICDKITNLDEHDIWGDTPLMSSVISLNISALKILINKGANLNSLNGNGHSPLVLSVLYDCKDSFNCLVENKADFFCVDKNKNNILHHIVMRQCYKKEYCEQILKNNTELLNMKNKEGKTPLDLIKKDNLYDSRMSFFMKIIDNQENSNSL